jgi:hypothetical protein
MALTLLPYKFGVANDAEIKKLEYFFAVRLQVFLLLCRVVLGLDVLIVDGWRSDAEQDALHARDSRNPTAAKAKGRSHQAGKAADLNFFRNGVAVLRKATPPSTWKPVYALAAACGILNGSTFPGYPDNDHFYIT